MNKSSINSDRPNEDNHPFFSFDLESISVKPKYLSYLETLIHEPVAPYSQPYLDLIGTEKSIRLFFCGSSDSSDFARHFEKEFVLMYLSGPTLATTGKIDLTKKTMFSNWNHQYYHQLLPQIREARDCFVKNHLNDYVNFVSTNDNTEKKDDRTDIKNLITRKRSTSLITKSEDTKTSTPVHMPMSTKPISPSHPPFAYKTKEVLELNQAWCLRVKMNPSLYKVLKWMNGGSSFGPEINGKRISILFSNDHPSFTQRLYGDNPQLIITSSSFFRRFRSNVSPEELLTDKMRDLVTKTIFAKLKEVTEHPIKFEQGYKNKNHKMLPEALASAIDSVEISWTLSPCSVKKTVMTHLYIREDLFDFIKSYDPLSINGNVPMYGEYHYCPDDTRDLRLLTGLSDSHVTCRSSFYIHNKNPILTLNESYRGVVQTIPDKFGENQLSINDHLDLIVEGFRAAANEMQSKKADRSDYVFATEKGWVTI